jgi:DNA-binding MarR family transcriptional regulator
MTEHVQRLMAKTDAESLVEQILCARQFRSSIFGQNLFGDPAWDIVLVLYLGQLRNEMVPVARLAEAASVSANGVERWLAALDQQGLIERTTRSASDNEDVQVALSQKGSSAMRRWLAQWLNCPCEWAAESQVTSLLGRILRNDAT